MGPKSICDTSTWTLGIVLISTLKDSVSAAEFDLGIVTGNEVLESPRNPHQHRNLVKHPLVKGLTVQTPGFCIPPGRPIGWDPDSATSLIRTTAVFHKVPTSLPPGAMGSAPF